MSAIAMYFYSRAHVDPLNRLLDVSSKLSGLDVEVEVLVRAKDNGGVVVMQKGWKTKVEPGLDRLQVAVVRGQRYWGPVPPLEERVEQKLRSCGSQWAFWLDMRQLFWSYMDRSLGPDGHWYWRGTNCQHPSRRNRSRQWRVYSNGRAYSISVAKLAWSYLHGPLPNGQFLSRRCADERCDNPSHYYVPNQASYRKANPRPTRATKSMLLQLSTGPVIAQYHEPLGVGIRNTR